MLANGARAAGKKDNQNLYIVINRRKAIEKACAEVGSGGVVAITAKGTESSIIGKGGERQAWSDSGQAHEALRLLKTHS
jgi:UDP-N-acetylmuramyl tripeptide synthase